MIRSYLPVPLDEFQCLEKLDQVDQGEYETVKYRNGIDVKNLDLIGVALSRRDRAIERLKKLAGLGEMGLSPSLGLVDV